MANSNLELVCYDDADHKNLLDIKNLVLYAINAVRKMKKVKRITQ
jgi:hypothetical protein